MRYIIIPLFIFFIGIQNIHAGPLEVLGTEWPPYNMLNDGEPIGLSTETIISVLKIMGIDFKIKFYPWKRAVKMIVEGEADALFGVSKNSERERFLYFPTTSVHQSRYVFFIRKQDQNKLRLSSYEDLRQFKVGVTAGYSYTQELWDALKTYKNYQEATEDTQNIKKLAVGRIDYFPCDLTNCIYLSKTTGVYDSITFIDYTISTKDYYLAFSKASKYPDLMPLAKEFDKSLKAFKQTEEYRNIVAKYLH